MDARVLGVCGWAQLAKWNLCLSCDSRAGGLDVVGTTLAAWCIIARRVKLSRRVAAFTVACAIM